MSDYTHEVPALGVIFEVDRLRRERHELIGELNVRCTMPGALTVNGSDSLIRGDFNFSSVPARKTRANALKERAQTNGGCDWLGMLEEVCQKIHEAERTGNPDIDLRTVPPAERGEDIDVDGFVVPVRHPSIIFGDGGACKSLFALYVLCCLAGRGMRVGYADWELDESEHALRLQQLAGSIKPEIRYLRCDRPLVHEADRIQRWKREQRLDHIVYDSVAVGCDGPPESAEAAAAYYRSLRMINTGCILLAHRSKAEDGDMKPFGSTFWFNLARSVWFVKRADESSERDAVSLGFYHRKNNVGALRQSFGMTVRFGGNSIGFSRAEIADTPDLASKLTIRQRMTAILQRGAMPLDQIVEELSANRESVQVAIKRNSKYFVVLDGGRIGLRA